jgi:UDP-galactose transporter
VYLQLTIQNSALILIMHYSRIMPLVDGQRYHTSTSVFLNEVIKLSISLAVALHELSQSLPPHTSLTTLVSTLGSAIISNESWKLAIPAVLYTIQNTLQYIAVSNLDAATFQVTYQLKILTTAVFSVVMLGRTLSARKWMALVLLVVGVSIIQVPQHTSATEQAWPRSLEDLRKLGSIAAHKLRSHEHIVTDHAPTQTHMNPSIGLLAVLIACALSGLAGVSFEKILKDSPSAQHTTLWVRNCQLSFWSLFPSLFLGVLWKEGAAIRETGFFAGYNWVVWMAIGFQAAGGIVVALVINYADNIAKNFATSVSIVLSCVASSWFFEFRVTVSVSCNDEMAEGWEADEMCGSSSLGPVLSCLRRIFTRSRNGIRRRLRGWRIWRRVRWLRRQGMGWARRIRWGRRKREVGTRNEKIEVGLLGCCCVV